MDAGNSGSWEVCVTAAKTVAGWGDLDILVLFGMAFLNVEAGQKVDPKTPRVNNGITGDARRSNIAIGKRHFDMKVDYAVAQIRQSLGTK